MLPSRFFRRLLGAAGVAASVAFSAPALAVGSLYVFGDSLSDSGNNALVIGANGSQVITGNGYIPTQPYGQGAYTNGLAWVNSFAAGLGLSSYAAPSLAGGGNYAYGGARATADGSVGGFPPSATTQLNGYLAGKTTLPSDALYVIAIGGNDVRDTGTAVAANPGNAASIIGAAAGAYATAVGNMVDALQAKGASKIVVWDVPNVGRSPAALAQGALVSGTATSISQSYNSALGARLSGEAGVSVFDIFGLFNTVIANPAAYGLTNVTDACGAVTGCDPSKYLFWDGLHPTSAGHALVSAAMLQVVAVPEPGTAVMMAVGIVGVLVLRRRRA